MNFYGLVNTFKKTYAFTNTLKKVDAFKNAWHLPVGGCVMLFALPADAQQLADLSLEQLAALPVISVTKSEKPVSEAAASVFIITERDLRNAGSASLPEALRLAPNLQVARVDARNYAVTARGFNNPFENKLQVMLDGRTLYSPLFSGVYWDAQDVVLEDLNRIEVVSGAGGTLWGANAVNGVVNIVTRSAAETQGALVSVSGSEQEHYSSLRYGGSLDGGAFYRVYAKHSQHDDTMSESGLDTDTGWERSQLGFRMDWGTGSNAMTFQGDAYSGRLHQLNTDSIDISGANLLGRGSWQLDGGSRVSVQTYIDHTERDQPLAFAQRLTTFDVDAQQDLALGSRHKLVWGLGYRYADDNIHNYSQFAFLPENPHMIWRNLFAQNEIALAPGLSLTLGAKWEDNPYTGGETMPGLQLAWVPDDTKLVWAGASRAVRSPSRIDRDLFAPTNPPVINGVPQYAVAGGPDFVSETADVYELGYRSQPVAAVSWSATVFYSRYDRLRTLELNIHGPGLVFKNMAEARAHGMELWGSWQVTTPWRLHGGLVVQDMDMNRKPGSLDLTNTTGLANGDPDYYWLLRSSYEFSSRLGLHASLRHVEALENTGVPAYDELDVHLSWSPTANWTLSLVGQNLLSADHAEFGPAGGRSVYERSLFGKAVWSL
jgi:iron complex outermembrane recepter protein